MQEEFSKTELDVESDVISIVDSRENLVVCSYPTRDLDRLLSFYNAAVKCNRDLVIDLKQAYLLKLFQSSDRSNGTVEWFRILVIGLSQHDKEVSFTQTTLRRSSSIGEKNN